MTNISMCAQSHSILIASSSEGLDVARALECHLKDYGQCTLWKDGPFGLSSANLESLIQAASQFEFAVIIFTPDDVVESRGISVKAPRDNIVFEMGLFMGALGRYRTFLVYCEDDSIKIPTDLAGVIAATYKRRADGNLISTLGPVATMIQQAIQGAPCRTGSSISMIDIICQHLARSHQQNKIMSRLKSLPGIMNLNVWPENRSEIEKISDLFVQFEDREWGERKFVIFFGQHTSMPITIYDLFDAFVTLDAAKLYLCLENLDRFLSAVITDPVSYLSVRDLFARHTDREYAEAQSLFESKNMLQLVHRAAEDVKQHCEGRKARQVKYCGLIADSFSLDDLHSAASLMGEMRAIGAEVIRAGLTLSPTHIVISCWSSKEPPWMIVTATNSDKSQLLLFAETPIVTQKGNKLVYYGDPSRLPSSEAVPHWYIHHDLFAANRETYRCLLHFHSDPLNNLAVEGDIRCNEGIFIPTVPHIEYGTERMGHMLAEAMIRSGTTAASVQNHGQWFVANSFDDALHQAILAHEAGIRDLQSNEGTHRKGRN